MLSYRLIGQRNNDQGPGGNDAQYQQVDDPFPGVPNGQQVEQI